MNMLSLLLTVIVIFTDFIECQIKTNVCSSVPGYLIPNSGSCWYNPDVGASPEEIIERYDHKFEKYSATTEDGYVLGIYRIPPKQVQKNAQVILLMHGITYDFRCWLALGNQSLAFKLSELNYDVWLGNFRGTLYSNYHSPNISKASFWNFTYYEMGYYDIPAMINLVYNETKTRKKIIYIGHSMGATASTLYAIKRKEEAEKYLRVVINVAPVVYMKHSFNFIYLSAPIIAPLFNFLKLLNIYNYGISTDNLQDLFYKICLHKVERICSVLTQLYLFVTFGTIPAEMLPMQLTISPSATSLKNIRHYVQEIEDRGRFQAYDYGFRNLRVYGSKKPPEFDVGSINVSFVVFYGEQDVIADPKDVQKFYDTLRSEKSISQIGEKGAEFDHLDFILNPQKISRFYTSLFETLKNVTYSLKN